MSEDLAHIAVSAMGPGEVDDLLREAHVLLRERFPRAKLYAVRVSVSWCDRFDFNQGSTTERRLDWTLQVDNDQGHGASRSEALAEVARNRHEATLVPGYAERVASVLREAGEDGWMRHRVLQDANNILDRERRNRQ